MVDSIRGGAAHRITGVMNMTKSFQAARTLAGWLDLPQDGISGAPRITVSGGAQVRIEGHRGLLEYSGERIAAAGAGCRVIVKGDGLTLAAMDAQTMAITGKIWAVEIE